MDLSPMSNTNLQGGNRNESGNNSSVALSIGDLSAQIVRKRSDCNRFQRKTLRNLKI